MRSAGLTLALGVLTLSLACSGEKPASAPVATAGASVDPATAGSVTATVTFEGDVPKAEPITITGDPKCVSENGAPQIPNEQIVVGNNHALQNVFVYVKDGLNNYVFPLPTQPVVLDQDKCR